MWEGERGLEWGRRHTRCRSHRRLAFSQLSCGILSKSFSADVRVDAVVPPRPEAAVVLDTWNMPRVGHWVCLFGGLPPGASPPPENGSRVTPLRG